jgi:hypothetical protein
VAYDDDIIEILGFPIDNISADFGNQNSQQTLEIHMGTNCGPLLADLFSYSFEEEFTQKLLHANNKPLAVAPNSTFRFVGGILLINNDQFHSYVDSIFMYPSELENKDIT